MPAVAELPKRAVSRSARPATGQRRRHAVCRSGRRVMRWCDYDTRAEWTTTAAGGSARERRAVSGRRGTPNHGPRHRSRARRQRSRAQRRAPRARRDRSGSPGEVTARSGLQSASGSRPRPRRPSRATNACPASFTRTTSPGWCCGWPQTTHAHAPHRNGSSTAVDVTATNQVTMPVRTRWFMVAWRRAARCRVG
jgi:hypothetical protein